MILVLITLPMQLMNDTSKFSGIGYLCIVTLFFLMTVIAYQTPSFEQVYNPKGTNMEMFKLDDPLLLIQSVGLFTFALYVMDCIFLIKNDMGKGGTEKNIMKMGGIGILTMLLPYFAIGLLGYISFGDNILGIDLYPLRTPLAGSNDIVMIIGQCLVIASVSIANVSRVITFKCHVFDMLGKNITWKRNVIWTVSTMFVPSLLGFVYPAVNDWVSLLGAFCMSSLMILFPGVMGYQLYNKKGEKFKARMIMVWTVVWVGISYTSAVLTILKMIGVLKIGV